MGDNVIPDGRASGERKQARHGRDEHHQLRSNEEIYTETCTREFGISPTEARGKLLHFLSRAKAGPEMSVLPGD